MELYLHSFKVLTSRGQEQLHFSTQVYLALKLLVYFYVSWPDCADALDPHLNKKKKVNTKLHGA